MFRYEAVGNIVGGGEVLKKAVNDVLSKSKTDKKWSLFNWFHFPKTTQIR